jgi:H+/Cl- antiporter ClcA
MFTVTAMDFGIPSALQFYLVLGVICGLAAVGFSKLFYWTEDQFEKLPIDDLWWPAIGALGLGVIVTGSGWHQNILRTVSSGLSAAAGCLR